MASHYRTTNDKDESISPGQSIIQVSFLHSESACPPDFNISNANHFVCGQQTHLQNHYQSFNDSMNSLNPLTFSNLLSTHSTSADLESPLLNRPSSDNVSVHHHHPNAHTVSTNTLNTDPVPYHVATPPPPSSSMRRSFSRIKRKRTAMTLPDDVDQNDDHFGVDLPPNKKARVTLNTMNTIKKSSKSPSLHSIDENSPSAPIHEVIDELDELDEHRHNGSLPMSSHSHSPTTSHSNDSISTDLQMQSSSNNAISETVSSKHPKSTDSATNHVPQRVLRRSARLRNKRQTESGNAERTETAEFSFCTDSVALNTSFLCIPFIASIDSMKSVDSVPSSIDSSLLTAFDRLRDRQPPISSTTNSLKSSTSPMAFGSVDTVPKIRNLQPSSSEEREESLDSISKPLSALNLNNKENECRDKKTRTESECSGCSMTPDPTSREWTEILSESVVSKWDAAAAPIRSSLKKEKRQRRCRGDKRVNWGRIECRNYEQRCGIWSGGVPNNKGPSLHLGRLLTESTLQIDEWKPKSKGVRELGVKERKQRVALFSPADLGRKKLKMDREEISRLNKSRENIGCHCLSIYKMKKDQIIQRLVFLQCRGINKGGNEGGGKDDEAKALTKTMKKCKKNEVMEQLMRLQFKLYGRYDVCCVDESCECFRNGIECQIDSDCCDCGGDTVYNNYIGEQWTFGKPPSSKRDSLSCGNPAGNTHNLIVTQFKGDPDKEEHDEVKVAEDGFVKFKSPAVQKYIQDWNEHYSDQDEGEQGEKEEKRDREDTADGDENIRGILNFDK